MTTKVETEEANQKFKETLKKIRDELRDTHPNWTLAKIDWYARKMISNF